MTDQTLKNDISLMPELTFRGIEGEVDFPLLLTVNHASALILRSLQILKAQGMTEDKLGVDAENESGAFILYQRLGYNTINVDTCFRKLLKE